jgi:hypothetical protein
MTCNKPAKAGKVEPQTGNPVGNLAKSSTADHPKASEHFQQVRGKASRKDRQTRPGKRSSNIHTDEQVTSRNFSSSSLVTSQFYQVARE